MTAIERQKIGMLLSLRRILDNTIDNAISDKYSSIERMFESLEYQLGEHKGYFERLKDDMK